MKRRTEHICLPGKPYPLGATYDGKGVNFAIHSELCTKVELCLFRDENSPKEYTRLPMAERSQHVWHSYIEDLKPGQLYGFRVHGEFKPEEGKRFNDHKLLLDPYAKEIAGKFKWDDSLFGYIVGHPEADVTFSDTDSAPFMVRGVVTDSEFDWGDDAPPDVALENTIIYEAHVKGLTKLKMDIPEELRGTYAGIAHPVMINYLKNLGITSLELMPVQFYLGDRHLHEKGLTNYWGYNSIGYFAPDPRYCADKRPGKQNQEFKQMVKSLHEANIEVILDVVYNHTGEGSEMGPTLSFRGIDNECYYRLTNNRRYYMDYTGTGNTLNTMMPAVLRLIMDSLRYWITEMHVDGFRFDLAATLARELHAVDRLGSFFDIIHQDPIISQVKLIAEPWDLGEGGYQIGKFPPEWAEWNGKYRDAVRQFWRGNGGVLGEFIERLNGSSDLYSGNSRRPTSSINFITAHDGFTMNDLVTYNEKHNEPNGENNMDGADDNYSCNWGAEGASDDPAICAIRSRIKRNFLATLLLSQGVPMLLAGDEFGNSKGGNNNSYCQDNAISWLNWDQADTELMEFARGMIAFNKEHPAFCRRRWFRGEKSLVEDLPDIAFFHPAGHPMKQEDWDYPENRCVAIFYNGYALRTGAMPQLRDDHFLLIPNASGTDVTLILPEEKFAPDWAVAIDTSATYQRDFGFQAGGTLVCPAHSFLVLRHSLG